MSATKRYCSVPQCSTYGGQSYSLHYFPMKRPKICKQWADALKIEKPITPYMCVCSKHFNDDDFHSRDRKRCRVKPHAVPSKNLPTEASQDKRLKAKPQTIEFVSVAKIKTEREEEPIELFKDKSVQTDDLNFFKSPHLLVDNSRLKAFTGVDFNVFQTAERYCKNVLQLNNNKTVTNLSTKILLVLVKLKLNLSFVGLGAVFHISPTLACRYFYSVLRLLSTALKNCIYWTTKCLKKYTIVLSCSRVQEYSVKTYSRCNKESSVKYLIGVTPSGLISFVSSSDKAMFNKECEEKLLAKADVVHLERAVERLKSFKFLKQEIAPNLLDFVDDAVTVIAALVNLSLSR